MQPTTTAADPEEAAMNRSPFLIAALDAAARGWKVFPVITGGKTPAIGDWQRRATSNRRLIYRWWADNSRKNIGVATGPSRLLVVDLDTARDTTPPPQWAAARGGDDVLRMLAADAGQRYPGHTFTVTTPSAGRHL